MKFIDRPFVQGADGVKVLVPSGRVSAHFAKLLLDAVVLPDKGYSRHMKFLRSTCFPVCSRAEQDLIAERVTSNFHRVDALLSEAAAARKLLGRLDQAILAKAFRGELVPQDPADEPASVLLERIRAERATRTPPTKTSRSRQLTTEPAGRPCVVK